MYSALSGPTDWILRYIKTTFSFFFVEITKKNILRLVGLVVRIQEGPMSIHVRVFKKGNYKTLACCCIRDVYRRFAKKRFNVSCQLPKTRPLCVLLALVGCRLEPSTKQSKLQSFGKCDTFTFYDNRLICYLRNHAVNVLLQTLLGFVKYAYYMNGLILLF